PLGVSLSAQNAPVLDVLRMEEEQAAAAAPAQNDAEKVYSRSLAKSIAFRDEPNGDALHAAAQAAEMDDPYTAMAIEDNGNYVPPAAYRPPLPPRLTHTTYAPGPASPSHNGNGRASEAGLSPDRLRSP